MDKLIIEGGVVLEGELHISGSKNAALPLMVASLLPEDKKSVLHHVPDLEDVRTMATILSTLGVGLQREGASMTLDGSSLKESLVPYDLVRRMRASILLLSVLLVRHGRAVISLPGGCAIGVRPVDWHLQALKRMGATIRLHEGLIEATAPRPLRGAKHMLPFASVGVTETIMMAAVTAQGTSVIIQAACEPEIVDLADYLNKMGGCIKGAGTSVITIEGVSMVSGCVHDIIPDRIETCSYGFAVAATGGDVLLHNIEPAHLRWLSLLEQGGVTLTWGEKTLRLQGKGQGLNRLPALVRTAPYPAFPTDLQAQFMALASVSNDDASCVIDETIFENRFIHVAELKRMNADITLESPHRARVQGGKLRGAPVMASDLRASMGLVIAALAAEGVTTLHRLYHLDRGYEGLEHKLSRLGASVRRVKAH